MSIAAVTSDYPALFRLALLRTLTRSLTQVQSAASDLTESVRDQALHILTFALKLDDAWPTVRDLLLQLAPHMERLGHRDDWLPYLEQGVTQSRQQRDSAAEAELSLQIGYLYHLRSQFEQAHSWFTRSLKCFQTIADTPGQARALNQMAFAACQQHQLVMAEDYTQAALALLDEETSERAASFNTLGLVARERGQWHQAEIYHRRALQIRRNQGDQRRAGWILQNLGNVLRHQGRYAEAIACYEEATYALDAIKDVANAAIVQMNQGVTYDLTGEPANAVPCYLNAEDVFRKLHDQYNLAKVLTNLGLSYLTLQAWESAEIVFISSSALFQTLGDIGAHLNALDGLGLVYIKQARWEEAMVTLQKAFSELPSIQNSPLYASLVEDLQQHLAQTRQALVGKAQGDSSSV